MQRFRTIIWIMFAIGSFAGNASAQISHVCLLMHGHKQVHESGVGLAGWIIAPSVTDVPDKWLALVGPRYDGDGWNVEFMGGVVVKAGEATALVDTRLELTPDLFGIPFYVWANAEWIAIGEVGAFYSYLQADYVLPKGLALIGLETENVVSVDQTDFSVGPHLVIPMGPLALMMAYQFHKGDDQFWTRLVLNL